MTRSPHVDVTIDLKRVRRNLAEVAARVGVPVWPTIKADAYGLGTARVARALADQVERFCVFTLGEAEEAGVWGTLRRRCLVMGPAEPVDAGWYLAAGAVPTVHDARQAVALAEASPALCVDTGMQRFACPLERVAEVLATGACREAFTHATKVGHVAPLLEATAGADVRRHAAATALLDEPAARLDGVRPGFAVYRGAVRVAARVVEARESAGPIGYTGWESETGRHGVILAGYSNGLRAGPVVVNGRRQRVSEVGMQSAYVTLGAGDRVGDEVVLLGSKLDEAEVAAAWGMTAYEVLLRMTGMGERRWVG